MSIKDLTTKIKPFIAKIGDKIYNQEKGLKIHNDLYIVLMLVLVGTASYGLGILSSYEKDKVPVSVTRTKDSVYASVLASTKPVSNVIKNDGEVVASKSGTKYYYPWCSGVSRIKEENKVWFKSIADAKAKGLTPATNCDGLQ